MTKTANILRFDPNGPAGLEEWEQMDYAALASGEPVQRGYLYHEIEDAGYMVGVWDCTAFTDQMMPYPVDEYMLLLKGSVIMALPDGTEITIKAGEAFVIPKGLVCQWKQPELVLKYFMILDGPTQAAENPSLQRVTVPNLAGPTAEIAARRTDFLNAAGTMRTELVTCGATQSPPVPAPAHQLISVLEGTLTLHDGEKSHNFAQGETAYLHQGDCAGWTTSAGTRLMVASYTSLG